MKLLKKASLWPFHYVEIEFDESDRYMFNRANEFGLRTIFSELLARDLGEDIRLATPWKLLWAKSNLLQSWSYRGKGPGHKMRLLFNDCGF